MNNRMIASLFLVIAQKWFHTWSWLALYSNDGWPVRTPGETHTHDNYNKYVCNRRAIEQTAKSIRLGDQRQV